MKKLLEMERRVDEKKEKLKERISNKKYIKELIAEQVKKRKIQEENKDGAIKAKEFLQQVSFETQNQISGYFEEVGSLAIAPMCKEPTEVKMEFVPKRNKTECELYYQKGKDRLSPMFSSGYGLNDMSSLAFRFVYCKMLQTRALLCFDEPMKQVSEGYISEACDTLRTLALSEGFQIILISNAYKEYFESIADKVFYVENGHIS